MPNGHWERDGQEFYFVGDLFEDFKENLYELDEIGFESWLDDNYDASTALYCVFSKGYDWSDFITEYEEEYFTDIYPRIEGEDWETDYGTYVWVNDDEDDEQKSYAVKPKAKSKKPSKKKTPTKSKAKPKIKRRVR